MAIEIETRFLDINKSDLISKLHSLGAKDLGESKLDEIIFYDQTLTWLDKNKFIVSNWSSLCYPWMTEIPSEFYLFLFGLIINKD